jgi:hypothetical protein
VLQRGPRGRGIADGGCCRIYLLEVQVEVKAEVEAKVEAQVEAVRLVEWQTEKPRVEGQTDKQIGKRVG